MIKSSDYQLWLDHYITTSAGGLTIISGKGMVRRKTGRNHGFFVGQTSQWLCRNMFLRGSNLSMGGAGVPIRTMFDWLVCDAKLGSKVKLPKFSPRSNYQNSRDNLDSHKQLWPQSASLHCKSQLISKASSNISTKHIVGKLETWCGKFIRNIAKS